ncbi:MAG TPA: hypothetical protein PLK76_00010 [bacterium]|nr:hypothetical protein [bacterium]
MIKKIKKYLFRYQLCLKAGFLILFFIFSSTLIAVQTGITDEISKIFYWPVKLSVGQVAGEYSVRIAATQVNNFSISQNKFSINGVSDFLLGASVFDAINWNETIMLSDLDYLAANKYNLIRVWADWQWQDRYENDPTDSHYHRQSTVYDTDQKDGSLDSVKIEKLKRIIDAAKARGIIVDLVITDFNPSYYVEGETVQSLLIKHQNAARNITTALVGKTNLFFDLMNEHDNAGDVAYLPFTNHVDINTIAQAVRTADPNRYITVSNRGESSLDQTQIANELATINNSIYTPHFSRTIDWWSQTGTRINSVRNTLNSLSPAKNIPIYLQEEQVFNTDPIQNHFVEAAKQAKENNAAGWTFHQTAGFDLKGSKSFKTQLGVNGQTTLQAICPAVWGTNTGCGETTANNNVCNNGVSFNNSLTSNPGSGIIVSGGNFSSAGWTTTGANNYIEYHFNSPFESGQIEFDISGLEDTKLIGETYDLFALWDDADSDNVANNAVANNRSKSFLMIFGDDKGAGAYTGKIRPRLKVNNTLDGVDGNITGTATYDNFEGTFDFNSNSISGDSALAAAYDWNASQTYGFRIVWGNGRLTYFFRESPSSAYYQIGEYDYSASGKQYNPTLPYLRLGRSDYGTVPGITFSNFKLTCDGVTAPPPTGNNCVANLGGHICSSNQTCSTGFISASDSNYCCLGSCVGGGSTTNGDLDLFKIDSDSRNPAVDVDAQGNLHISYDCGSFVHPKGVFSNNLCYSKVTSRNGLPFVNKLFPVTSPLAVKKNADAFGLDSRLRIDQLGNTHIVYNEGYIVLGVDGSMLAKNENLFPVTDHGLVFARLDIDSRGNAYVLYQYGDKETAGSFKTGYQQRSIRLKKIKYENGIITEVWDRAIAESCNQADAKRMTPGNIKINSNDVAYLSWRDHNEGGGCGEDQENQGIWYTKFDTRQATPNFATKNKVLGVMSDFSDLEIDSENNIHFVATKAWGYGLAYTYINNSGLSQPASTLFAPPQSQVIYAASERFGEANTICPALKKDTLGKMYLSFAGAGTQEMPSSEFEYYVAYYSIIDKNTLVTGNNLPNLFRFTPLDATRTRESDQGTQESNPIIGKAWNQGVFMVFEDNYYNTNNLFDIYLKGAGGAVIGIPKIKADFNCDGKINIQDFGILLSYWGKTEPPDNILHYTNASCKDQEKNLNLDNIFSGSDHKAVITENDFGVLLPCWGTPRIKEQAVCFIND